MNESIQRINVKLKERSYGIFIQNGLLKECGSQLLKIGAPKKIAILSSGPVYRIYGKSLLNSLRGTGAKIYPVLVDDGEKHKDQRSLFHVLISLAEKGFQRDGYLISLGGGTIGDLGGLAASLYMRGINFIQCPTTFLSQVDASVGGKTAIDFAGIKNLVGTFYQPKAVFIDPLSLKTLSERQFKTGLAEVIKYGVIQDKEMFQKIENNLEKILERDPNALLPLIKRSCEIKAKIVSEDEREGGKRAWLNYGHTLGHALESYFEYNVLTHGEAVAYGMWFAAMLSFRLKFCPRDVMRRQFEIVRRVGLLRKIPHFKPSAIYRLMLLDKKARNGKVQFILTRKIGLVTIQKNVPKPIVFSALTQFHSETSELR